MQTVTSLTEQLRVLRKGGPVTAGRSRKGLNEPTLVLESVRDSEQAKSCVYTKKCYKQILRLAC